MTQNPKTIIPSLTSGMVIGMLEVVLAIAFGALIYGGPLAPYLPLGAGYALAGAIISGTVIALLTSWRGFVGGNQDVPAAIMALMSASIIGLMPPEAAPEATFATVAAAVALTTLMTGLFFLSTGFFRLGGLARFLPYPVVGGFLAGTGWLLVTGALGLMADLPANLAQLPALFQSEILPRWLPGVLLAVVIMFVLERSSHFLILPGMLLLSFLLYFLFAWANGFTPAELSAGGWLLGPFTAEGMWRPLTLDMLAAVYWPAVLAQAAAVAAVALISTVSLLLNAAGVELAVDSDVDLDQELRVAGLANTVGSLAGTMASYQQLSFSVLNQKLGSNTRLTGLIAAGVCLLALLAGPSLLALLPRIIIGALLFLLGLSFLVEWLVEGWSRMPRVDYAIVLTILAATILVGFLQAVALGLLLAVILFVVGYSQVNVVRHEMSGATLHSRVVRSRDEEQLLKQEGQAVFILQLQGFIFFGTADSLYNRVRRRLDDRNLLPTSAVILDFTQITGIDSTAVISFGKLKTVATTHSFELLICGANRRVHAQLEQGGLGEAEEPIVYFDSVDQGLAHCEQRLLARVSGNEAPPETEDNASLFVLQIARILRSGGRGGNSDEAEQEKLIALMFPFFEELPVESGTLFIEQGQPAESLYVLLRGQVTAQLPRASGGAIRLETMGSGRVIGEIGFYLGSERTAEVVADEPSTLLRLTRENMARMEREAPQSAALLHRLMVQLLGERVVHLTSTVRALEG